MTAFDLIGRPASQPSEPATDLVGCGGPLPPPITAAPALPPYSGPDAVCDKCLYGEAHTYYRRPIERASVTEWNGVPERRGPLPERHERECVRCGYRWDEALAADTDGMTIDALAHALHRACPYPIELDGAVREDIARELLLMLRVSARAEHPLWQYSQGAPTPPTAEEVTA